MKTVVVACETIKEELLASMEKAGVSYPVEYIESGLHERPKKLAKISQELLDSLDADRVLMSLGQCGNAMIGIKAANFQLILPKVDDCLSLIIGSTAKKTKLSHDDRAFFMTEGWLKGESTIMSQFAQSVEKYGEDTALSILEMMYANYETIGLVDTGIGDMEELYERTEHIADLLGLTRKQYQGTTAYIEELLTGPWDKGRFIVKEPFEEITADDYQGMLSL